MGQRGGYQDTTATRTMPGQTGLAHENRAAATLAPNPAADATSVYLTLEQAATVRVRILDLAGLEQRRVPAVTRTLAQGTHALALPVGELRAGTYLVEVMADGPRQVLRLVVE